MTQRMKQGDKKSGLTKSKLLLWTIVVVILLLAVLSVWSKLSFIRDQLIALAQIIAVVLLLLIAVLLGVLLWLLFRYLSTDKNDITVLPFDIASGEDKLNGRAIADEYTAQCLSIKQTLERRIEGVEPESVKFGREVTPDKEQLSRDLVNFATVGVGTTTVSIGQLIVALRRLWPGSGGTTFTGTLQRYEKALSLTMSVKEGTKAHVWEVSKEIGSEGEIPGLVRDLAFKVLLGTDTARLESAGSSYVPSVDTEIRAAPSQTDHSKLEALSAKTWEGLKHYADAREAYHQYKLWGKQERLDDARLATLRAITAEPDYTKAFSMLVSLGYIYGERGDSSKAGEMFRHAIKAIDLGAINKAVSRSDLLASLGWSLIKDGAVHDAPEAIQVLCEATTLDRKFGFAWSNLGIAYDLLDNGEKATKAHDISLKCYAKEGDERLWWTESRLQGLLISTQCLFAVGNYEEALRRCWQAIEAADENDCDEVLATKLQMIDLLRGDGRFADCLEECRQAAQICGESAPILNTEGYIHTVLGNYDEADDLLHKALQQGGDASIWSNTWWNIGHLNYCRHRYQDAIDDYMKARDLTPESPEAYMILASLYRRIGRKEEFDSAAAEARKRFGRWSMSPYSLACFEAVCGDQDEALRLLEIALQRKHVSPTEVRHEPDLDFVRIDKRYKDLMRRNQAKVAAPDAERRDLKSTFPTIEGWWRRVEDRTRKILHGACSSS